MKNKDMQRCVTQCAIDDNWIVLNTAIISVTPKFIHILAKDSPAGIWSQIKADATNMSKLNVNIRLDVFTSADNIQTIQWEFVFRKKIS
jgi:hypothetical protein